MYTRGWVLSRFILPFVWAATTPLLHVFWPHNQTFRLLPIFLPFLAAVFNMAMSSSQRPRMKPHPEQKPFRRELNFWHAQEGLACILLMLFEAVVAGCISSDAWIPAIIVGIFFYIPYSYVSICARRHLLRAYEILTEQLEAGGELVRMTYLNE